MCFCAVVFHVLVCSGIGVHSVGKSFEVVLDVVDIFSEGEIIVVVIVLVFFEMVHQVGHVVSCFVMVDEGIGVVFDLFVEVLLLLRSKVGVFFNVEKPGKFVRSVEGVFLIVLEQFLMVVSRLYRLRSLASSAPRGFCIC